VIVEYVALAKIEVRYHKLTTVFIRRTTTSDHFDDHFDQNRIISDLAIGDSAQRNERALKRSELVEE